MSVNCVGPVWSTSISRSVLACRADVADEALWAATTQPVTTNPAVTMTVAIWLVRTLESSQRSMAAPLSPDPFAPDLRRHRKGPANRGVQGVAISNNRKETPMSTITIEHLTKQYGPVTALDKLSFEVRPGRITAFLGANGSGKTTTMRVLLGLSEPTSGHAMIGGQLYEDIVGPLRVVGAVLDQGFHPNRTALNHLRIVAAQAGVSRARVHAVLDLVGLADAAKRRVGGYSLGMRQRLALASAMVGEPSILVLDEPFNGLDPDGIMTMRNFLRHFADDGGTVFLSSHLLAEVAHSADDVIIIDHGRLVTAGAISELSHGTARISVTSTDTDLLAITLGSRGADVQRTGPDSIIITGVQRDDVGRAAIDAGAVVTELRTLGDDLESVFQNLIHRSQTQIADHQPQHPQGVSS
jgi:ABC-2 type transport system ATP-binding protein